eukprot:10783253-Alexandrium_andersonii.AAC.1
MGTLPGDGDLVECVRDVGPREDDSLPQSLQEVQCVSDRVLQTGQDDALALADQSVDLGTAEVPDEAMLDCAIRFGFGYERQPVDREVIDAISLR